MKALTCAGYEYMKLMVSELQRQLDEIEGTKGLTLKSLRDFVRSNIFLLQMQHLMH